MGLSRTVRFPQGGVPGWGAVAAQLRRVGGAYPVRMIDGLPAFPDEVPAAGWAELRVGTAGGMVTLRAAADAITCVVWGNAPDALRAGWDALAWACAEAGGGVVETPGGDLSAAAFAAAAGLQPA